MPASPTAPSAPVSSCRRSSSSPAGQLPASGSGSTRASGSSWCPTGARTALTGVGSTARHSRGQWRTSSPRPAPRPPSGLPWPPRRRTQRRPDMAPPRPARPQPQPQPQAMAGLRTAPRAPRWWAGCGAGSPRWLGRILERRLRRLRALEPRAHRPLPPPRRTRLRAPRLGRASGSTCSCRRPTRAPAPGPGRRSACPTRG
mmetsp:Transcript_3471/g.14310  ORF Transcript_3471/g.14310 Transcript_3471/m.14310 type:complete len:201 (+) Transcript_3471:328-930(+)